jgi:multiple sugar transport system substrate-binding protein
MLHKPNAGLALLIASSVVLASCAAPSAPAAAPTSAAPAATQAPVEAPTEAAAAPTEAPTEAPAEATAATEATPVVPEGVTTIKVVDWVPENITSWANRWYKPFEEANPDIKIVHEQITGNYIETVLTRLTGDNDIDLIWVAPDSVGSFLRSGAAMDLTNHIKEAGDSLQIDKFPKWTLEDYTKTRYPELPFADGQYGLPLVMFVWQLWFNSDMMQAAGLTTPERGWTWDDFTEISKKLTDESKKQYGYQNQNWTLPLYTWVWQNGGDILTPDAKQLAIGQPAAVEAFKFLQDRQLNDKIFVPIDQTAGANPIGFDSGNAGMITRGNWNLDLSRDWKFKWDIGYPPKNAAEGTLGEELGIIINKNSPKAEAAWRVLKWIASPEGQRTLAATDVVPNSEVMREVGLTAVPDNVRNLVVPLASDPMVHSAPQWFRPKYTPGDLADRLAVLWTGEKTAEELLPAVEKEFNEALSKPMP